MVFYPVNKSYENYFLAVTKKFPNFLIIGAPRCGTTSAYHYLTQHPEIYMSSVKEPNFFSCDGLKTGFFNGPETAPRLKNTAISKLSDYELLFEGVTNEKAVGEASVQYLWDQRACVRIKYYVPAVKLIAILRDPVERAFSHYLLSRQEGWEPATDFAQLIEEELAHKRDGYDIPWRQLDRSFYYRQLRPYFDSFSRQQIKICLFEDFLNDPTHFVQELFRFLGVDGCFVPDVSEIHRSSYAVRNKFTDFFLRRFVKPVVKRFLPESFKLTLRARAKRFNMYRPKLQKEMRSQLIEVFRGDILKLQDLIHRDLSPWLRDRSL